MKNPPAASLDPAASTLRLEFESLASLREFAESAIEQLGFLVPLDRELRLFHAVEAHLVLGDELDVAVEAEVAKLFDSVTGQVGTAFLLKDWTAERAAELRGALDPAPAIEAAADPPADAPVEAGAAGETRGVSVAHEIRGMNVSQKAILATRAGRPERQVLLRDTSPQVLMNLLGNPRLEGKDVLRLVKTTHATAAILQRVAKDSRWGKNQEILANVARNPKTPIPLAIRTIERLRTSDLRMMSKMSGGVRDVVRRAALREYLKRSSR